MPCDLVCEVAIYDHIYKKKSTKLMYAYSTLLTLSFFVAKQSRIFPSYFCEIVRTVLNEREDATASFEWKLTDVVPTYNETDKILIIPNYLH